ncbi:MAG: DUF4290 domain-containing protein [Bacteroidaceae bacterium]|nr:DUF4290 domain-containing protein [Bacteroidaceae bacterium]
MMNNTDSQQLLLPEYGRNILKMVEHALTIPNREERLEYARRIIEAMGAVDMNTEEFGEGYRKYSLDYTSKLWDHLAYLSNYELDIDYPVEITKLSVISKRPECLPYPQRNMRYRHYGVLVEQLLDKVKELPEGNLKNNTLKAAGNRMKRNLADWKGDGITNDKVARDIAEYTNGELTPEFGHNELIKIDTNHRVKNPNSY